MYAVGVVITLEDNAILEEFIFSHFALLENRLHQLHSTAFRLLCQLLKNSPTYYEITPWKMLLHLPKMCTHLLKKFAYAQAKVATTNSLIIPYKTLCKEPLWLNMSTFPQQRSKLAKSLLNELTFLLENF